GSLELVGRELFTKELVPFELTTALLIVAVVGAIAVARAHVEKRVKAPSNKPAAHRLFHGPLHPRDAGHPLPKEHAWWVRLAWWSSTTCCSPAPSSRSAASAFWCGATSSFS